MSKYRESLIDRMINLYGYEHHSVIYFARLCETWQGDDNTLRIFVEAHEGNPEYWGAED